MSSNEDFFVTRQAAAVLKHGVLGRYLPVFVTMAGTGAREVVLLDGYAGPGRYDDDSAGSPLLLLRTARKTRGWSRNVRCVFVEADHDNATNLRGVLAEESGTDLQYQVFDGDIEHWAERIVTEAADEPMLSFLDPFGAGVSYRVLTEVLLARGPKARTEVLLNINVEMVRRIGGLLSQASPTPSTEKTLAKLDSVFGDTWWRTEFLAVRGESEKAAAAAQHVVEEFCRRVQAATGFGSFIVPIRRRPGHQPLFLLTLFYRHEIAPWKFNEAASVANAEWRKACAEQDLDRGLSAISVTGSLFEPEGFDPRAEFRREAELAWKVQEEALEAGWVRDIAVNLQALLAAQESVIVLDSIRDVYGPTLGLARELHLRRAWDTLDPCVARPRNTSVKLQRAVLHRG